MRIAVVIPCYRVSRQILSVLASIPDTVDTVIVVDDKCPENSGALVRSQCRDPRVRVIEHEVNKGVGGAVLTGYKNAFDAGYDVFVKIDGDGQMDLKFLNRLINPILVRQCDYTKGNRFFDLEALKSMPAIRRFGNFALTLLTKIASGHWHVSDPTNGYTAIHRQAYRLIASAPISERYFFETSLLVNLNIVRGVVLDIPIPARYGDENSSLRISRVLATFPSRLVTSLVRRIVWRYYVYDVSAVSLLLPSSVAFIAGGVAFGAYRWTKGVMADVPQTAGTVAFALLPILLGFMMLLQALLMDFSDHPKAPICRLLNDEPDLSRIKK